MQKSDPLQAKVKMNVLYKKVRNYNLGIDSKFQDAKFNGFRVILKNTGGGVVSTQAGASMSYLSYPPKKYNNTSFPDMITSF